MSDAGLRYETVRRVSSAARVVLADNPGPMTLTGTNTWLLRGPGATASVVVDPGPDDERHLRVVAGAAAPVTLILLTHRHPDHSDGAARLHDLTGAPVRAADPAFCVDGDPLRDGETIDAAGAPIRVLATPGHTSDSVSFVLDSDPDARAVLTGDTILGLGTTVVAHPDGDLRSYLASLRRVEQLGAVPVLPGHGPELPDAAVVAAQYLAHREQRLAQVRHALDTLGPDASARQIVELVYADVDPSVWDAAELSVEAQLAYLRS